MTTFVGDAGVDIVGMSFHPDGTLFGIDVTNDDLVIINTTTGAITKVADTTFPGLSGSMAIDCNGNAFVIGTTDDTFRTLSLTTGAVSNLAGIADDIGATA